MTRRMKLAAAGAVVATAFALVPLGAGSASAATPGAGCTLVTNITFVTVITTTYPGTVTQDGLNCAPNTPFQVPILQPFNVGVPCDTVINVGTATLAEVGAYCTPRQV